MVKRTNIIKNELLTLISQKLHFPCYDCNSVKNKHAHNTLMYAESKLAIYHLFKSSIFILISYMQPCKFKTLSN